MMSVANPRPAVVAGLFYPHEAAALRAELARHLAAAPAAPADAAPPKLLVVPHAGYVYSAPIAAHAYARLEGARGRIRRVVLLGPAHRVHVRGLALPGASAFETPLGTVPVDAGAVAAIEGLPQVTTSARAHEREHSLEVQLPFLQALLGEFSLLPLVVGDASADEVAEVLDALWGGDETLVVVSSDLSHYLRHDEATARDAATARRIVALDPTLAHDEACGATPINGALVAAKRRGLAAELLDLRNSGDTAGDRDRVVGYAAIAFAPPAGDARDADDNATDAHDASLGPALLARARNAIGERFGVAAAPEPGHARLAAPGATFVTLQREGRFRGCIGRLVATRALDEDVRRNAVAAAFSDPRVPPCRAAEFESLEIEVSLLGAHEPIAAASEAEAIAAIEPRRDGLVLRWRERQATLLPQVWQQLPAPLDFLAALKEKAGLPGDFWSPELTLARYRVQHYAGHAGAIR